MRTTTSLLLLGAAVFCRWQDPKPVVQDPVKQEAVKPGGGKPDSGKPDAAKSDAKKDKGKIIGKPERSPLEGVYRLRRRVNAGIPENNPSKGYMAITGRHLFLSLASKGPDETMPLLHAGVREWTKDGPDIRTTAKLDYYTDDEGVIHQTPEGKQEKRRIQIVRGGVRVMQGRHSWLEFERVE